MTLKDDLGGILRAVSIDVASADKRTRGIFSLNDKEFEKAVLEAEDRAAQLILNLVKKRLPEKPHDYDKWAEHIRLGYDWAIEAMAKELE